MHVTLISMDLILPVPVTLASSMGDDVMGDFPCTEAGL